MFGIKHRKELKKEMEDENLTPTKDLKVDESELTEEQKEKFHFPWAALIIVGSLILIIVAIIIVIYATGGPIK